MPAISASAPGKIILFGEHAAVYSRPAIAAPVHQVRAHAYILADPAGKKGAVFLDAPDIKLSTSLNALNPNHPLSILMASIREELQIDAFPACKIRILSTIPIASGLGSGTAVSVAIIRAVTTFLGSPMENEAISRITYEVEKIYHGTPSGIDNTVITFEQPIFFRRNQPFEFIPVAQPIQIIIADSGIRSKTSKAVQGVRDRWEQDPQKYEAIFDAVAQISLQARAIIESGQVSALGPLMTSNHAFLHEMGVSCPELDHLVTSALKAGAIGAKLSGAGLGGNMIALVHSADVTRVEQTLVQAGAVHTISMTIPVAHTFSS
jgi:mevalonate kinase